MSPAVFREKYAALRLDPFLEDVWTLVEQHFRQTRSIAFYAEKCYLT